MMSSVPLITVATVTYNHEQFIVASLRSVLEQTEQNFEIVVVDDGSTDNTADAIASIDDPRIRYIHQENQGPGAAANTAVAAARGEYIAMLSGDDLFHPNRLRLQLERYRQGETRILFSDIDFVDEEGNLLDDNHFADGLFDTSMTNRADIYRRFFDRGNFINAITFFSETKVLQTGTDPYNPLLYQLQDYDLWIRLIKQYRFEFMPERTVRYRIRAGGQNLSAPALKKVVRNLGERYLICKSFFIDCPDDLLREAFHDRLRKPDFSTEIEKRCEAAFLLLSSGRPVDRLLGLEQLQDLFYTPEGRRALQDEYNYGNKQFSEDLFTVDVERILDRYQSTLFIDTGEGLHHASAIQQCADFLQSQFSLTFDLDPTKEVKGLRWDPVENLFCTIWLARIEWKDADGETHVLQLDDLETNGVATEVGRLLFTTLDAMIFLPIRGHIAQVSIHGKWEILNEHQTAYHVGQLICQKDGLIHEKDTRIHELNVELHNQRCLVHEQNQTLNTQNQVNSQQQTLLQTFENEIAELKTLLNEKESNVGMLEQEKLILKQEKLILEREKRAAAEVLHALQDELTHRDEVLHQHEHQLTSIYASRSWKLVTFLRRGLSWVPRRKAG